MCHGRLRHSVWLHFVLIAVAIQGVVPDAQDLASINILLLFFPALADSRELSGQDGLPDEVCGPAQPELGVGSRGRSETNDLANRLSGTTDQLYPLPIHHGALRSHAHGKHPRIDELITALCRLKC
jgi:hypothetical protein